MNLKPTLSVLCLLCLFSLSLSAQWTNINSTKDKYIRILSYPTQKIGYALMEDSGTAKDNFHKTIDGGLSWNEIKLDSADFYGADIIEIHFPSPTTGYMAFRKQVSGLKALIYKTTDGGLNWASVTPMNFPVGYGYMDVHFTDDLNGYAVSGNQVYKTTDGGANWSFINLTLHEAALEIDFHTADYGIFGTWDGTFAYKGSIYLTKDGGLTWDTLVLNNTYSAIGHVDFAGNTTAYALTDQGFVNGHELFKTSDLGASWDTLSLSFLSDSLDQPSDMLFTDESTGFLSTQNGYVYKTIDGALNWTVDHFEGRSLNLLATNGKNIFTGGPANALLTNNQFVGVNTQRQKESLIVYPNPIERGQNLYFSQPQSGLIELMDLNGKKVASQVLNDSHAFNLSHVELTSGIYIYLLRNQEYKSGKISVK